jgi:hypothetical protein
LQKQAVNLRKMVLGSALKKAFKERRLGREKMSALAN